jgi:ribosomal protein L44E
LQVQNQTLRVKALADHRGNELHPLPGTAKAKEKVRAGGINKLVGPGKENVTGKASLSLNCSSRGTKLNVPQKGDKTVLVDHRGNELHPLPGTAKAKEKVRVGGISKLVGPGKENVTGKASLSLNCSSRGTKLDVPRKGDKTVLVRQKVQNCRSSIFCPQLRFCSLLFS